MKKLFVLLSLALFMGGTSIAQDKLYLVFEFMKVDNEQEQDYRQTERFWEKIHQERANNGDIIGWDLWRLQPGGEDQGYQYMTVNLYDDPVKMMSGAGDFWKSVQAAYPDKSEEYLNNKIDESSTTRDLAIRLYLEQIAATTGEFDMPLGTVASIDLMKAKQGSYGKYVKAESEVFKPMHQRQVDAGEKGSWGLLRVMSPWGSDIYTSHITVNMYKDYEQFFMDGTDGPELTEEQQQAIQDGLETRDLRYVYMGTLIGKVRKKS